MAMSKYFRSLVIGLNPRADNIAIEKEEKKVADELKNRALIAHTIYILVYDVEIKKLMGPVTSSIKIKRI